MPPHGRHRPRHLLDAQVERLRAGNGQAEEVHYIFALVGCTEPGQSPAAVSLGSGAGCGGGQAMASATARARQSVARAVAVAAVWPVRSAVAPAVAVVLGDSVWAACASAAPVSGQACRPLWASAAGRTTQPAVPPLDARAERSSQPRVRRVRLRVTPSHPPCYGPERRHRVSAVALHRRSFSAPSECVAACNPPKTGRGVTPHHPARDARTTQANRRPARSWPSR